MGSTALEVVIVDHRKAIPGDPAARRAVAGVEALLRDDRRVSVVVGPRPGSSLSSNGRTGVITGGAAGDPDAMVNAATALQPELARLAVPAVSIELTGDSALWSQFNSANRSAMLRSEVLSWR